MPKALPPEFITLSLALATVKALVEINDADTTKDAIITLQLDQYSGTSPTTINPVFQVFFNAALFVWETPSRQIISEAGDGVKFNRSDNSIVNEPVIKSLIRKQLDANAIYGVESPVDLEDWLKAICNQCGSLNKNLYGVGAFLT